MPASRPLFRAMLAVSLDGYIADWNGGDVRELAARLRTELAGTGKDIWLIGGGNSIAAFHEAGLVDRWELSIIPALLHDGIPLFPNRSGGLERLQLTRSWTMRNGIIEAWYEPAPYVRQVDSIGRSWAARRNCVRYRCLNASTLADVVCGFVPQMHAWRSMPVGSI